MSQVSKFRSDIAYRALLDLILSGRLPAGAAISERQIADTFDFGRTPVREAMKALARDGLLDVQPARGTFVRGIDEAQLHELFEVRQALETKAAELAAKNADKSHLDGARNRLLGSRCDLGHDVGRVYDVGADFHVEIFRQSGNAVLLETYLPVRNRFRVTIGLAQHYDPGWVACGIDEHVEILDAIASGNSKRAGRLMSAHLDRSYQSKKRILSNLRDQSADCSRAPAKGRGGSLEIVAAKWSEKHA